MRRKREELIRAEIQRRVLEEAQRKDQRERTAALRDSLDEVTSLTQDEVDRIAASVRADFRTTRALNRRIRIAGTIIALLLCIIIGIGTISIYNSLVDLEENVHESWGQVENVYQRRVDLIPDVISSLKAHTQHEEKVVRLVAAASERAGRIFQESMKKQYDPHTMDRIQEAQTELSAALRRVLRVIADNQDLQSDEEFIVFQAQLEGAENRISIERKRFNEAVRQFNAYRNTFPRNLVASLFGFEEKRYFQTREHTRAVVEFD